MNLTVRLAFAFATAAILAACAAAPTMQGGAVVPPSPSRSAADRTTLDFSFTTLDNKPYSSFNRPLGINDRSRIVGYFGSGQRNDPSVGYLLFPPYHKYRKIQYPTASETIVTTLNDRRVIAGYYKDPRKKATFGFAYVNGLWFSYQNPHARGAATQLLGLNDSNTAVGFYESAKMTHPFEVALGTGRFDPIDPPGGVGTGLIATAINGHADVVGYLTSPSGATVGFVRKAKTGQFKTLSYPYASETKFLGITAYDRIVGFYVDNSGVTHGLLLMHPFEGRTWQQIDEPSAAGTTVVTGINLHNDIVGWYVDGSGKNHGFLATPK